MEERSILQRTLDLLGRYSDRLRGKLQNGPIGFGLVMLMVLASMFKTELILMELTVKVPLLIMVALLYVGYTYYTRNANKLQRRKKKTEESRVKTAILILSLTSVSAHVFVKYVGVPVDIIQWWIGVWSIIGGDALNEILGELKDDNGGDSGHKSQGGSKPKNTDGGSKPKSKGPKRDKDHFAEVV